MPVVKPFGGHSATATPPAIVNSTRILALYYRHYGGSGVPRVPVLATTVNVQPTGQTFTED